MVEFWFEILEDFPGSLTASSRADGISAASLAKFPSSNFDAAVHDVAIGNFDALISDVYITAERARDVSFLPSIGTDYFYLTVPYGEKQDSYWELLAKPFEPFSFWLWLSMVAWGFITALVLAVCAGPGEGRSTCKLPSCVLDIDSARLHTEDLPNPDLFRTYLKTWYLTFSGEHCATQPSMPHVSTSRKIFGQL